MAISPRNLIKLSQSSSKSDERPLWRNISPALLALWSHHLAGKYFGHKWRSSYFMNMVSIPFTRRRRLKAVKAEAEAASCAF